MKTPTNERMTRCLRACFLLVLTVALVCSEAALFAQEPSAVQRVRVPKLATNVHQGPTTARPVLVLAPKDTVLTVVGRRGEWLEVELRPELRERGMVMRWYENEERGFVHESTVEPVEEEAPPR